MKLIYFRTRRSRNKNKKSPGFPLLRPRCIGRLPTPEIQAHEMLRRYEVRARGGARTHAIRQSAPPEFVWWSVKPVFTLVKRCGFYHTCACSISMCPNDAIPTTIIHKPFRFFCFEYIGQRSNPLSIRFCHKWMICSFDQFYWSTMKPPLRR